MNTLKNILLCFALLASLLVTHAGLAITFTLVNKTATPVTLKVSESNCVKDLDNFNNKVVAGGGNITARFYHGSCRWKTPNVHVDLINQNSKYSSSFYITTSSPCPLIGSCPDMKGYVASKHYTLTVQQ